MTVHDGSHEPGCFGCKLKTLQFATSIEAKRSWKQSDKQLSKDLDAYKRLRHNGVQPEHVDGSALLEAKANDSIEVEHRALLGHPLRDEIKKRAAEMPKGAL